MEHPILFSIGGVNFYSYGFFVAMAFLITYSVFSYLYRSNKMTDKYLFEKMLVVLLAGFLGARILFFLLYYKQFSDPLVDFFRFWIGGYVSFGGILGSLLAILIIFRKKLLFQLDMWGVAFMAGAMTWRIGCFLAHDHPGVFSTAWYAINYEAPAILFEIILSFIGFVLFFILYKKKVLKINGMYFFLVFAYYGAERIFTDIFRADPEFLSLKTGQWAGIAMLLTGMIGVVILKIKNHKKIKAKNK